jgi:hypothetical protein
MARSQNGWPAGKASDIGVQTFTVPGTDVAIPIKAGDVATVLLYVAARFHREVEPLNPKGEQWCWGYANRPIRGSQTTSNHASGTAIDLNAPAHPLGKRGTFTARQVKAIRSILDACGGTVRWGGDYSGRADEMHFEINAGPAAVARVAARLGGYEEDDDMLRRGQQGPDVGWLQNRLNVVIHGDPAKGLRIDGDYGPVTASAVAEAKRLLGWGDDNGDHCSGWFGNRLAARIAWNDDDRKRQEHLDQYHKVS